MSAFGDIYRNDTPIVTKISNVYNNEVISDKSAYLSKI